MLVCLGCGGRNALDLKVCPFCNRRLGAQAIGERVLRPRLLASIFVATLLLALFASMVLLARLVAVA
jgi:hypothetical protein